MRASDIRKGQAVLIDGKLFVVTGADHNTPGNLRAKVQFKLRDVLVNLGVVSRPKFHLRRHAAGAVRSRLAQRRPRRWMRRLSLCQLLK